LNKLELKHPNGFVLGVAFKSDRGWRFFPQVSGRHVGRKFHETADASLPPWARRHLKAGCSFLPPEPKPDPDAPRTLRQHIQAAIAEQLAEDQAAQDAAENAAEELEEEEALERAGNPYAEYEYEDRINPAPAFDE
jgi:hypothetical protein